MARSAGSFDGLVGLTATPQPTTAYFKDIVYRYGYERPYAKATWWIDPIVVRSEVSQRAFYDREKKSAAGSATGQLHFEFLEDQRELLAPEIDQQWLRLTATGASYK